MWGFGVGGEVWGGGKHGGGQTLLKIVTPSIRPHISKKQFSAIFKSLQQFPPRLVFEKALPPLPTPPLLTFSTHTPPHMPPSSPLPPYPFTLRLTFPPTGHPPRPHPISPPHLTSPPHPCSLTFTLSPTLHPPMPSLFPFHHPPPVLHLPTHPPWPILPPCPPPRNSLFHPPSIPHTSLPHLPPVHFPFVPPRSIHRPSPHASSFTLSPFIHSPIHLSFPPTLHSPHASFLPPPTLPITPAPHFSTHPPSFMRP